MRASTGSVTFLAPERNRTLAFGVDELLVAAHLVGPGGDVVERLAGLLGSAFEQLLRRGAAAAGQRVEQAVAVAARGMTLDQPQVVRAAAQLRVDLAVELVGGEHVHEHRGEQHGDRDRGGRGEA